MRATEFCHNTILVVDAGLLYIQSSMFYMTALYGVYCIDLHNPATPTMGVSS